MLRRLPFEWALVLAARLTLACLPFDSLSASAFALASILLPLLLPFQFVLRLGDPGAKSEHKSTCMLRAIRYLTRRLCSLLSLSLYTCQCVSYCSAMQNCSLSRLWLTSLTLTCSSLLLTMVSRFFSVMTRSVVTRTGCAQHIDRLSERLDPFSFLVQLLLFAALARRCSQLP